MTTIQEIESAVEHLPTSELEKFRAWFSDFDAQAWDRQFKKDVQRGSLDRLGDQALKDLSDGRCSKL